MFFMPRILLRPEMIDAGIELLIRAGMPRNHILYAKLEDMRLPASVIDNAKCVLYDECLFAKPKSNCIVGVSNVDQDATGRVTGYERLIPKASSGLYYNMLYFDEHECIRWGACIEVCPVNAVSPGYGGQPKVLREPAS